MRKRYIITKISIIADPTFEKNIFEFLNKKFKKYIGEYYSPFSIKKLLENIDELIANKNLQFVSHNVEEKIDNKTSEIEVVFNIFETEKLIVERINVTGNNVTNESVIRGELLITDPFSVINLDKSIAKLNLEIFLKKWIRLF